MNLEEQLIAYKKRAQLLPKAEKIQQTISKSKGVFYAREQEKMLTYGEFLWLQFKMIQKKWWFFQMILLLALWALLIMAEGNCHFQRSAGIIASMFVILIIPGLWKNRTNRCMEVEASSYYTLRQIYSARMLLFGIVDILLITVFCGVAAMAFHFTLTELLVQFLFPMVVTACICFGILCSKYFLNEAVAVGLCLLWSAIWWRITLIDSLYTMVTLPIWILLFAAALAVLATTVYRTLNCHNKYWEANFNGIESN